MSEHSVEKDAARWPACVKYPALECVCRGALMENPTSDCIRERTGDFAPVVRPPDSWFREAHEIVKARNAEVPPHARMVVTDPALSAHTRENKPEADR